MGWEANAFTCHPAPDDDTGADGGAVEALTWPYRVRQQLCHYHWLMEWMILMESTTYHDLRRQRRTKKAEGEADDTSALSAWHP